MFPSPLFPGLKRECCICEAVLHKLDSIRFCTACHANVCARCCDALGANLTIGPGSGRAQPASSSRAVLPPVVPDHRSVRTEATAAHIAADSMALASSRVSPSSCGIEAVAAGGGGSCSSDEGADPQQADPQQADRNRCPAAPRHGASAKPLASGAPAVTAGGRAPDDAGPDAPVADGAPPACLASDDSVQGSSTGAAAGSCTAALDTSGDAKQPLADCSEGAPAHSGAGDRPSGSDTVAPGLPADAEAAGTCCCSTQAAGQGTQPGAATDTHRGAPLGIAIDIHTGAVPETSIDTHTQAGGGDSGVHAHTHTSSASVANGGAEHVPAGGVGLRERGAPVAGLPPAGCSHPEGLWPSHVAGEAWVSSRCGRHG